MKEQLRLHCPAILAAVAAAFFGLAPHFTAPDTAYVQHDEIDYAVFTKEVFEGNYFYGESPRPYPRLPFWILGTTARVFGSVERAYVFFDGFSPFVCLILAYLLLLRLTGRRLHALLGACAFVFAYSGVADFRLWMRGASAAPLYWSVLRHPDPGITGPLFLGALMALESAVRKKSAAWIAAAAALGALGSFLRPFDWAMFTAIVVIGLAVTRRKEWAWVAGLHLLLSIPGVLIWSSATADMALRAGRMDGRYLWPDRLTQWAVAAVVVTLLLLIRKMRGAKALALYAGATALCMNGQLILGWTVQPSHWRFYHLYPLIPVLFILGIAVLLDRFERKKLVAAILAILLAVGASVLSFRQTGPDMTRHRVSVMALQKTDKPQIVMTLRPEVVRLWSNHKPFLPRGAYSRLSNEELLDRLSFMLDVMGKKEITVADEEWITRLTDFLFYDWEEGVAWKRFREWFRTRGKPGKYPYDAVLRG